MAQVIYAAAFSVLLFCSSLTIGNSVLGWLDFLAGTWLAVVGALVIWLKARG